MTRQHVWVLLFQAMHHFWKVVQSPIRAKVARVAKLRTSNKTAGKMLQNYHWIESLWGVALGELRTIS